MDFDFAVVDGQSSTLLDKIGSDGVHPFYNAGTTTLPDGLYRIATVIEDDGEGFSSYPDISGSVCHVVDGHHTYHAIRVCEVTHFTSLQECIDNYDRRN